MFCSTVLCASLLTAQAAFDPCRITVIDAQNGWPVPLVELRTTGNLRFITDNAGVVALDAPELMNRETWFFVSSDGYEVPADGFGIRGVRITPRAGESIEINVQRTSIAKRLGRITGAGIFSESQKLGDEADWTEQGVVGCDSVQNTVHRGRLFWLWGDTALFHYPLGIFDASSATTDIRPIATFEPPIRLRCDYFRREDGKPRGVAPMPGPGPTWLTGYTSLPDADGNERLVAFYAKIRQPMNVYEWGLCSWNEEKQVFERERVVWEENAEAGQITDAQTPMNPPVPEGHACLWTDDHGVEWVLFGNPFPAVKCRATYEAWLDVDSYERLTPQQTLAVASRTANHENNEQQQVAPHSGTIAYHPWRGRWVTIFMEKFGSPSAFGEVWCAEADSPFGPWGPAVKILSHANYTFYNPRIHSEWFEQDSPVLIFEGTYSQLFANRPEPTPRYDYNQILYRVDLDDPALDAAKVRP